MKNELIYDSYYWVKMKGEHEILVAYFYDDGFGGVFQICGDEEIYPINSFDILEIIPKYHEHKS